MAAAFHRAGFLNPKLMCTMSDMLAGRTRNNFAGLVACGGLVTGEY